MILLKPQNRLRNQIDKIKLKIKRKNHYVQKQIKFNHNLKALIHRKYKLQKLTSTNLGDATI